MLRFKNILIVILTNKKIKVRIFIVLGLDVMFILSPLVCLGCTQISFYALWC